MAWIGWVIKDRHAQRLAIAGDGVISPSGLLTPDRPSCHSSSVSHSRAAIKTEVLSEAKVQGTFFDVAERELLAMIGKDGHGDIDHTEAWRRVEKELLPEGAKRRAFGWHEIERSGELRVIGFKLAA